MKRSVNSAKKVHQTRCLLALLTAFVFNFILPNADAMPAGNDGAIPGTRPSIPFIGNQGQITDDAVLFHTRTFSGPAYVKNDGSIVYTVAGQPRDGAAGRTGRPMAVIEEVLLGTTAVHPIGVEQTAARINFLQGRPENWQMNAACYNAVDLPGIYPGIHLQIRARHNNIEKIFTIAPGADPGKIQMHLSGVDKLNVNEHGELVAGTALGDIRFTRPIAWQEIAEAGGGDPAGCRREKVEIAYAVDGASFRFQLGAYDAGRPLMIDPLLAGTFIGGSGADVMTALARDAAGNIYAAGYTDSAADFPMAPGVITNYQGGLYDAVVVKFDAQLSELLSATFLGGSGMDQALAITFNSANNSIYVGGVTDSTNFTGGAANHGGDDGFIVRLDTNLQNPLTRMAGGADHDAVRAICAHSNKIYAVGESASPDFNLISEGSIQPPIQSALRGATNAFAAVLAPDSAMSTIGATYLGGNSADAATALAFDGAGNLILAGRTSSTNFPTSSTGPQKTLAGGSSDAFIAKISAGFTTLQAGTYLGGPGADYASAVAVDISNHIYVAGYTDSGSFPTSNIFGVSYRTGPAGLGDIFLTRLSQAMTNFQASTYFGGSGRDAALALAVNGDTNQTDVILAGVTQSSDIPTPNPNADDTSYNGGDDVCLAKFGNTLTNASLRSCFYLGGAGNDVPNALLVSADTNSFYLAGATASAEFPQPGFGYQNANAGGASDGFLTRINIAMQFGAMKWKYNLYDPGDNSAIFGLPTMGWDGTIYVAGGSNLYAINSDGSFKWMFKATQGHFTPPYGDPSYGMGSTPAIDTNGNIYICASYAPDIYLYCIKPDGSPKWISPKFNGSFVYSSPAISSDGLVYVNALNSRLYGMNVNNGEHTKIITNFNGSPQSSPAIATNGIVYSLSYHATYGHTLYAIKNTTVIWTNYFPDSASGGRSSPAIGSNGVVYVCAGQRMHAVATNGSTIRTWSTASTIYSSPAIDSNGMVYVGSSNRLYSFNGVGGTNWTLTVDGVITSSPTIGNNGNIYVGDNIYLYSIAPAAGQINWKFELDDYISHHSPLIGADGTIYMTDLSGLYAIYGPEPLNQASAWATFSHDVLRTGNAGFDPRRYATPTGVTASKGTYPDRVAIGWNAISNVISYEIWRSTSNDTATAQFHLRLNQTNFMDTAIIPGQVYYYWLRAKTHVVLLSGFSVGDFGGTPPIPPQAVTASKGVPTNYVHVSWQPSAFAASYDLYRSFANNTGTAQYVTSLSGTNFDDHAVLAFPGRTHYYWVTAANTAGWTSAFSPGDGYTNAGGIPPSAPLNLTAGKGLTSTNVPLAWNTANYDVTAYVIYRHTESNYLDAVPIATNGLITTYNDRGSVPFKPYYYWVRATNQYGFSRYSAMDFGYTVLLPPLSITASVDQTNRVNVSWVIESTNATSYKIYRGLTTNPAAATQLGEVPYPSGGTNFADFSITLGSEYYYFASACNIFGESDYSPPSNLGGTFPLPPTNLEASDGTNAAIIWITWTASPSPGTRGYKVYRALTFDPNYASLIGDTAGACVFDDAAVEPGKRYYYWAAATNRLGNSKLSGLNSGWLPLPAPASITATDGTSTSGITVAWSSVPNANRYEIWRNTSDASNSAEKVQNDWPSTTYHDTEVPAGIRQYYWVKGKNKEFVSIFSRAANGFRSQGPVDLAVRLLSCHPNVLVPAAHPEAVAFQVANLGPNNMAGANSRVSAEFYLSANTVFNPSNAHYMGAVQLNLPMNAGSSRTYTLNATELSSLSTPQVTPGVYHIFVFVNHALPSTWSDQYLPNNNIRRSGAPLQVNTTGAGKQPWNDYDGDGKADPAVYRAFDGRWRVWMSGSSYAEITAAGMGGQDFAPVPSDYDGDGKTDPAVYRAADGRWRAWLSRSSYAEASGDGMGGADYIPAPGDYDGDGKTDPAVYRAADGRWRIWRSSSNYAVTSYQRGGPGTSPAPGGYDYDALTDPAVYNLTSGNWRIWLSSYGYPEHDLTGWGGVNLIPVAGDYDGDGLTDLAIYHATMGYWFANTINEQQILWGVYWGGAEYQPVPGDYDGDGIMDLAVYHTATGLWFVQTVAGGILANGVMLGGPDYIPAGRSIGF